MSVERREFPVWFPKTELGAEFHSDHPSQFSLTLIRGFHAYSRMADMPEEKRGAYLDIGSGCGFIAELIAPGFRVAYGYEPRPEARAYAEAVHNRSGVKYIGDLREVADGTYFDYITFLEVIEHMSVADAREALAAFPKTMKPTGMLYITTPVACTNDGSNPNNHHHVHEYHPAEIRALVSEFFGKVEMFDTHPRTIHLVCTEPKL